jgi:hypothetical protein
MNRPVTMGCLAVLALLSGGTASAGVTASSAADGSILLLQNDNIIARQGVVTGAFGVPISVDIARGVALATLPYISKSALAVSGVSVPRLFLQSQTVAPAITPRVEFGTTQGAIQQASFVISGDQDLAVSITFPTSVALGKVGGGGGDVEFATTSSLGAGKIGQRLLPGTHAGLGQLAFDVGGHIEMKQNVLAGAYAGVLRVTVQYN